MGRPKQYSIRQAKEWVKIHYITVPSHVCKTVNPAALYSEYKEAMGNRNCLTKVHLLRLLHSIYPSTRIVNGKRQKDGGRAKIIQGLALATEVPGYGLDHTYTSACSGQTLDQPNTNTPKPTTASGTASGTDSSDSECDSVRLHADSDSDWCDEAVMHSNSGTTCRSPSSLDSITAALPSELTENEAFMDVLKQQLLNAQSSNHRWSISTIRFALEILASRRKSYDIVSKVLKLPSARHLRRIKNFVEQKCGFNEQNLHWMDLQAKHIQLSNKGRMGCLILDEMQIEKTLEMESASPSAKLIGYVDYGPAQDIHLLRKGENELATHILQLIFLGDTGFRHPVAHFATTESVAAELYVIVWEAVAKLRDKGFSVNAVLMDGSANNRAFLQCHFGTGYCVNTCSFVTNDRETGQPVVLMMDPMHQFKKIRNSLIKSIDCGHTEKGVRLLKKGPHYILWQHWKDAYEWDFKHNNMKVYHKLSDSHIDPSPTQLMRNHLATDVLNKEMLHLMKVYRVASKRADLNLTIELLENTSILVSNYTSELPVRSSSDNRLDQNRRVLQWFDEWHSTKIDKKAFITQQTYEDLHSMIKSTDRYIKLRLQQDPSAHISMHRLNSDLVENMFSSQRGINGANTNPSLLQYGKNLNTIIISQNTLSTKRNSSSYRSVGGAVPYHILARRPFRQLNRS